MPDLSGYSSCKLNIRRYEALGIFTFAACTRSRSRNGIEPRLDGKTIWPNFHTSADESSTKANKQKDQPSNTFHVWCQSISPHSRWKGSFSRRTYGGKNLVLQGHVSIFVECKTATSIAATWIRNILQSRGPIIPLPVPILHLKLP